MYIVPISMNVEVTPVLPAVLKWCIRKTASGPPIIAPPPNPMIAIPVAIPGRSMNHLMRVETGEIYPSPSPIPPDDSVTQVQQPKLVELHTEGGDEESRTKAEGGHEHGLARTGSFEPFSEHRRGESQEDDGDAEDP